VTINPDLSSDPVWKQLQTYWGSDAATKGAILEQLRRSDNLAARSVSYDPPPGSIPLE